MNDNAQISTGDIDFTLVANVRLTSLTGTTIIANKGEVGNMNNRDFTLFYDGASTKFAFRVGNGATNSYVLSSNTVSINTWYTVVAWHDSQNNTLNLQVNSGAVNSVSYAGGASDTSYPLTMGAFAGNVFVFNGRIDEVALYKRVLTFPERNWLYNTGMARAYADLAQPSNPPMAYTYGDLSHKHAVTVAGSDTYSYDANGNMTTRVEGGVTYTQTFDAENRLASVTVGTQTTQFIYDGDGNLVKKINQGGSRTIYIGGLYEVYKDQNDAVTKTVTYYPAGGAMRINIVGGSNSVYYILKDYLGSASVVTDTTSPIPQIVGENRYYPYGETRFTSGTIYTDKLFTGQRDMGLGIYHYGAWFYSAKTGRFLSPDSIIQNHAIPQFLNRYTYTLNNPLRYTDPTGHVLPCEQGDICQHPDPDPVGGGGGGDDDDLPGHHEDDVDLTDPNPNSLRPPQEPTVCSSSMCNPNGNLPIPTMEQACHECAFEAFEGTLHFLEGAVLAGSVAALVVLGLSLSGPVTLIAVPFLLLPFAAGVNWAMVGVQEIIKGTTNNENMKIDYLPLVHLIFPDALRFK